jgi:transcriptional regulator with XRE-family HTH domain
VTGPPTTLADRIARLRQDLGLTQAQVAANLEISQQAYARYEASQRKIPIDLLPRIAEAFEVSIEDLLGVSAQSIKRGPLSQLERRFEQIQALPKKEQRFIIETLDRLLKPVS